MQMRLAESRYGRVLLHLICALHDHQLRWHWRGILREFSRVPGLNNTVTAN
jgi:hypothetical protein